MLKVYDPLHEMLASSADQPVRLRYYASELLLRLGADDDPNARSAAVHRTMQVCHAAGIAIDRNFRQVYVYAESVSEPDWLLSPLAGCLFLLNGDPNDPWVAKAQLTVLLKMTGGIAHF